MPGRILRAAAVIVAAVIGCVAVEGALDFSDGASSTLEKWEAAASGGGSLDVAGSASGQPPEGFEDEAVALSGRADVRVGADGSVIGFVEKGSAGALFSSLSRELEAKGWSPVDSGADGCGSFVKDAGRYRWLFVSCAQAGDAASAVIQCAPPESPAAG